MQYLDKLKKERSLDRVVFVAGAFLALIGFLVPTVYVKQVTAAPVDNTVEVADEDEIIDDSDELFDETEEEDDYEALMNAEAVVEEESDGSEPVIILKETVKDFVYDKNYDKLDVKGRVIDDDNPNGVPAIKTTVNYSFITKEDVEKDQVVETKLLNIFGIASAFNVSPYAYNATFLVAMWLCAIACILLFFITKSLIGDVVALLIGLGFGIASAISVPETLIVTPIVGYMTVGGYLVIVGWIVAIAGTVLGAAHIQHPGIATAE